jgi:HxlR-like helix-turn-helix protein
MLSERLRALIEVGAVAKVEGDAGPEYSLTEAGAELTTLLAALGGWGQRWLARRAEIEDVDLEPLLVDMQRRVRLESLPPEPLVVRFDIAGHGPRYLLLKTGEVSFCAQNPGFPEALSVRARLANLIAWWRGDVSFLEARRQGLVIEGPKALVRDFPGWFDRYLFADVASAAARGAA